MITTRREWVFDLDNTLYPASCDLFAQIDARMTEFVAGALSLDKIEARALQKRYYAEHGTTLNGLMTVHGLEPDAFLDYVHDIDLTPVSHAPALRAAIDALPGRKFVYTNGSRGHADRVVAKLGLAGLFDGVHAIEDSGFTPKPKPEAFEGFVRRFGVDSGRGVFFEDLARNLVTPHAMGFATVLVHSEKDWSHEPEEARPAGQGDDRAEHIHYETGDLPAFLADLPVATG